LGRGAQRRAPAESEPWWRFRAAALPPPAPPTFGLLTAGGTLRLLHDNLAEYRHVLPCGTAFALADWTGDGKVSALCSQAGEGDSDSVLIDLPASRDTLRVEGTVLALAAGTPPTGEPSALVFLRPAGDPG